MCIRDRGDADIRWNYVPTIAHWRRMPAGGLRCMLKQVRFSNSYTLIDSTTLTGTASTDGTANTVTLEGAGKTWLPSSVDYYLSFEDQSYVNEYLITTRNSDTVVTVTDALDNLGTSAARTWKMKGYKRGDVLNMISYVIDWAPLSMSQTPYRSE